MSIFEVAMLICFGISWPISIIKTIRTKEIAGKSPVFLVIVAVGYISGIIHKALFSFDWVITLYILNCLMVIFDCFLYFNYAKNIKNSTLFPVLRGSE